MPTSQRATADDQRTAPRFLESLKNYKEFITILVFFLGGFFWIYGYFATKKQVDILKCLLDQNIALVESRMQTKFFFDELTAKGVAIKELIDEPESLSKRIDLVRLTNESELLKKNLESASARYTATLNNLKTNMCEKTTSGLR